MQNEIQSPSNSTLKLSESGAASVEKTMLKLLETGSVQSVYAPPIEHGETMIIPAAEVLSMTGFGTGSGGAEAQIEEQPQANFSGGGGGGGGGYVLSRPVAVIIADEHSVRVEPVVDVTKVALAFFTSLGFIAATLAGMKAKRHKL